MYNLAHKRDYYIKETGVLNILERVKFFNLKLYKVATLGFTPDINLFSVLIVATQSVYLPLDRVY
jgi:hypothetical protein